MMNLECGQKLFTVYKWVRGYNVDDQLVEEPSIQNRTYTRCNGFALGSII